jgi:hypothetical protein
MEGRNAHVLLSPVKAGVHPQDKKQKPPESAPPQGQAG